jgi:hypothetical protein
VNRLKRHLSVANVLSATALFVALSGTAYATSQMAKNSVKTRHLGKGAVTTQKLRNGAVTTPKLRNGAVIAAKLRDGSVVNRTLADASVRAVNLGGGVVTSAKLKNGAVNNSKLGSNAVTTGKIGDGAVTGAKLSSSFLAQLVRNVTYVTKESEANPDDVPKTVTAECPGGKQVTGGGALIKGADVELVAITESAPALNTENKRTGWRASAREISPEASSWSVEVYAVCAEIE